MQEWSHEHNSNVDQHQRMLLLIFDAKFDHDSALVAFLKTSKMYEVLL